MKIFCGFNSVFLDVLIWVTVSSCAAIHFSLGSPGVLGGLRNFIGASLGIWKHIPNRYYDSEDYDYFHRSSSNEKCAVMTTDPHSGIGKWIKTSCNDTNGYVCLRNVDPTLPDSPEPTTAHYVKLFNDSIKVVTQQMTWEAAKMHCESDGAKLASLRNEWADVYAELMALNLNVPLWIGLNKKETGGYFIFIDGWHMTSTNWDDKEPSSNRDCVFVNTEGKWGTADCNTNMSSICMKSTDVPPTQSSEFPGFCPNYAEKRKQGSDQSNGWLPFRAYCYLFVTKKFDWASASSDCAKQGGTLASIEDPSEQEFIERNVKIFENSHTSFWMGLFKTHKGMWHWLDKTALDYTNWREGQPDTNNFGLIKVIDGKWFTNDQWLDRGYVCKTPKVLGQVLKATVNPTMDPQTHGHNILAVVLVITAIAIGIVITLFLFKKSGRHLPILGKSSTFDNPLFFNNERARPGPVDTNKLVANAEEEDLVPITTV